jgi:SAM-dependent methyltransferase
MPQGTRGEYDDAFYEAHLRGSIRSARAILGRLFSFYRPKAVVDVGCGRGAWLSVAQELGSEVLDGYDGPWVQPLGLLDQRIRFTPIDLEERIPFRSRYDLCICVEVAEHLRPSRGPSFVDDLCRAADVVLFSAAVPHQGGEGHTNECWQSDWAQRFARNNYEWFDVFRGWAWSNAEIDWWYRQNTLLFVAQTALSGQLARQELRKMELTPIDLIHPELYVRQLSRLQSCLKTLDEPYGQLLLRLCIRYAKRKLRT